MKNILLIVLVIALFSACEKQQKRYTQQSPEIDIYKKVIDDYEKRNWEDMAAHYADSAKIMNNVTEENAQTLAELVAMDKDDASLFSGWDYLDKDSEYEMVVTNKGETWVNFWGTWQAKLKANDKTYTIPAHSTAQFTDGKIVKEFGYWDLSKIMLDMQALKEADNNATEGKDG